jgi:hypothetical protein
LPGWAPITPKWPGCRWEFGYLFRPAQPAQPGGKGNVDVDQPSPNAFLPHALTVAHQGLCRALDLGVQEFEQTQRISNPREICLAVERFVEELRRVPELWVQLERRSRQVEGLTGNGSDYDLARTESLRAYTGRPRRGSYPRQVIAGLRSPEAKHPTLLGRVCQVREYLERALNAQVMNLSGPAADAFRRWLHKCVEIQRECERLEVDGCHFLYHLFAATKPEASQLSQERRRLMEETPSLGGVMFAPMRAAADSLVAWAAENLAGAARGDDSVGGAVQADLQPSSGQLIIDAVAALRAQDGGEYVFAKSGDGYEIAGFGKRGHFKKTVGFGYLEKLLTNAGEPVLMVELVGGGKDDRIAADRHSRQPALDEMAKTKCQEQLGELEDDIARAKQNNNSAEQERLEKEKLELVSWFEAATGIGGRDRDMNDPTARFRPAIHGALRRAYDVLRKAAPPLSELADHLEKSISSKGATFSYAPTPLPDWSFDQK